MTSISIPEPLRKELDDGTPLILMQGVSGSGKSTLARQCAKEYPSVKVVSRDLIREELLGKAGLEKYFGTAHLEKTIEDEVTRLEDEAIVKNIMAGHIVIVDNTNLRIAYISRYGRLLMDAINSMDSVACGQDIYVHRMDDISLEEAKKRVSERGERDIPEDVIRRQLDAFRQAPTNAYVQSCMEEEWQSYTPRQCWYPPFDVEPYQNPLVAPLAVICDIDGTLAHRAILMLPSPHMRSYFDYGAAISDSLDASVAEVISSLHETGIKIIFLSGRKRGTGEESTRNFIRSHLGFTDDDYQLFMRDDELDRMGNKDLPDDRVKYRLFNENVRGKYNVLGVFDDRKRVVALWEALGLRVFNVGLLNEVF